MAGYFKVAEQGRGGYYNGFYIAKWKSRWQIYNSNGEVLRKCKTLKECKERIDNQTV